MKWIIVLSALVSLGHCQGVSPKCPNPVECITNPCQDKICPRFLNAVCEADNCNGECRAVFYHRNNLDATIDNCDVKTCSQKNCSERRICVEEAFPSSCPAGDPRCRQYMRSVCELPLRPIPPSDCSVVLCGPGMICQVFDTRNGPEARCVEFRPTTCEELGPCDSGMECRHRSRDGKHSIVRCVPARVTPQRPRDCSELECENGFDCMLFGAKGRQRVRCVIERPAPKSCEELNCEAIGMICLEGSGRPRCRPPKDCSEAKCSTGVCTVLNISHVPNEFRCPFNEDRCKLELLTRLEGGRILACRDPTLSLKPCSEVECPDDKVCASKIFEEPSYAISVCTPKAQISTVSQIATCDTVPDDFCEENEACIDFQQGDYRGFAHCSQINCNATTPCIEEEDTCIASSPRLLEESGISHSCAPIGRISLEADGSCATGRSSPCNANITTCTDLRMNSVLIGSACIPPLRLPPRDCSQLSCADGEECVQDVVNGQVVRASCSSSQLVSQLLSALGELDL